MLASKFTEEDKDDVSEISYVPRCVLKPASKNRSGKQIIEIDFGSRREPLVIPLHTAKFDGKEYPVQGAPAHNTVSLKRVKGALERYWRPTCQKREGTGARVETHPPG